MPTVVNDIENARPVNLLARGESLFVWGVEFSYEFRLSDVLDAMAKEASKVLAPFDAPLVIASPEDLVATLEPGYASDRDSA